MWVISIRKVKLNSIVDHHPWFLGYNPELRACVCVRGLWLRTTEAQSTLPRNQLFIITSPRPSLAIYFYITSAIPSYLLLHHPGYP